MDIMLFGQAAGDFVVAMQRSMSFNDNSNKGIVQLDGDNKEEEEDEEEKDDGEPPRKNGRIIKKVKTAEERISEDGSYNYSIKMEFLPETQTIGGGGALEYISGGAVIKGGSVLLKLLESLKAAKAAKGVLQYSDDLLKAAQQAYPKLAGKTHLHHITPQYLGGPANGLLIKLDAAYHQQITNAFRAERGDGIGKPSATQLDAIMKRVYSQFPLPK